MLGHCSSFTGALACHNISCHIVYHRAWDVICTGCFAHLRLMITKDSHLVELEISLLYGGGFSVIISSCHRACMVLGHGQSARGSS
jgi:hypothetical protein